MSMFIGEALSGEGNEIAHIDLLIGSKDGPVGTAFANALARQSEGHTNLLAVLTPNLAVKPAQRWKPTERAGRGWVLASAVLAVLSHSADRGVMLNAIW